MPSSFDDPSYMPQYVPSTSYDIPSTSHYMDVDPPEVPPPPPPEVPPPYMDITQDYQDVSEWYAPQVSFDLSSMLNYDTLPAQIPEFNPASFMQEFQTTSNPGMHYHDQPQPHVTQDLPQEAVTEELPQETITQETPAPRYYMRKYRRAPNRWTPAPAPPPPKENE